MNNWQLIFSIFTSFFRSNRFLNALLRNLRMWRNLMFSTLASLAPVCSFSLLNCQLSTVNSSVENKGLEPLTPCVQGRCSKPTELIPRMFNWQCTVDNWQLVSLIIAYLSVQIVFWTFLPRETKNLVFSWYLNCQLSIVNCQLDCQLSIQKLRSNFCSPRQSWTADLYIISVAL